jgi:FkbM family methyltransferase
MKELVKRICEVLHISLTRNQRYDMQTRKILRMILKPGINCIDIGCHRGEFLNLFLRWAPGGRMYAFEPIPSLFEELRQKYQGVKDVMIHKVALFDFAGETSFQYVLNAPAYSGIKRRRYDLRKPEIEEITVPAGKLDQFIPSNETIGFIKIDVEGAEYYVLKGGSETIKRSHPIIIFEYGKGAADLYGIVPGQMFDLLTREYDLHINTLNGFLRRMESLDSGRFDYFFETGKEYYFIAYP